MGTLKLELLECVTQAGAWERGESINMVFDSESGKIKPAETKQSIDNYRLLEQKMGEVFWSTNYAYNLSMKLLSEGNREQVLVIIGVLVDILEVQ